MVQMIPTHLATIDAQAWPAVAFVTATGPLIDVRSRRAEAAFARACAKAGITLDGDDPDLVVEHEELFVRLAERGWVGFAESYMAGEWRSDRLVTVLSGLLASGFKPGRKGGAGSKSPDNEVGNDLPADLIALYSGDGVSRFGGLFAQGVRTTQRETVPSYARGAGRGNEPKTHFVDVTDCQAPGPVEREDLPAAQSRAIESLLDLAHVAQGTDFLEFPSAGGGLSLAATHRGATADIITADHEHAAAIDEFLTINGANHAARMHLLDMAIPSARDWGAQYDAIVSAERLETLGPLARAHAVRALDRMLGADGFFAFQTVVATASFGPTCAQAVRSLREYIWPGLNYPQVAELHRLIDRQTGLRITAEVHCGKHYQETLRLQREMFEGNVREAAAAGFDAVFRRLWVYQFALLEAMFRLGCLDAVQVAGNARSRRGRR